MQEISWGNLPRYFFKEYETGLSINAVALGCKAELMREDFPPLPCLQETAPPTGCSKAFSDGFGHMKKLICTEKSETNPMSFLCRALYNTICCHKITHFEFISQRCELQQEVEKFTSLFCSLSEHAVRGCKNLPEKNREKLIIILETKNAQALGLQPSLYSFRQGLLQRELLHMTITLADSDEYHIGTLYALLAATAVMLKHIMQADDSLTETI